MVKEKKFVIEVTAKELVGLKINSITSAKRWIDEHSPKPRLDERSVERSVESVKTADNDRVDNKESVGDSVSNAVGDTESYKPEPVQKTKSDYWKRLRESMGDVD